MHCTGLRAAFELCNWDFMIIDIAYKQGRTICKHKDILQHILQNILMWKSGLPLQCVCSEPANIGTRKLKQWSTPRGQYSDLEYRNSVHIHSPWYSVTVLYKNPLINFSNISVRFEYWLRGEDLSSMDVIQYKSQKVHHSFSSKRW